MSIFRVIPVSYNNNNNNINNNSNNFLASVVRLINLSGRAGLSGAKPREFERKIYLYICMYVCLYIYFVEGVRTGA